MCALVLLCLTHMLDTLDNKNVPTVAKALVNRFSAVGFPRVLQSDNAKSTTTDF